MAYASGNQQWVIDVPEPKWKKADEYQKQYQTLLSNLKYAVKSAARDDFPRFNWLIRRITKEMQDAVLTARRLHDDD